MAQNSDWWSWNSTGGRILCILSLLAVLAAGFWLRSKEITWGLPEIHSYLGRSMDALHPDESVLVQEATDLRDKGIFHVETLRYPPLQAQLAALAERWFLGSGSLWQRFLVARGVSIAASIGSIVLLFFIGLRWSPRVALIACALFSLSMVAVRESHWANPEPLSAFWVLAALLFFIRTEASPSRASYGLMGIALALGIASKYFAALFLHLPLLSLFISHPTEPCMPGTGSRNSTLRTALQQVISAYAAFTFALLLLLGIYIVRNPNMLVEAYQSHSIWAGHNGLYGIFPEGVSVPTYTATILPIALAPPVYWLALAGMVVSIIHRKRREILIISAILPFWVFLELLRYHPLRFSLSLAPVLCLFAAIFFDLVFRQGSKLVSIVGITVLSAVLVYSGIYCFAFINVLEPNEDTRLLASNWIDLHAPDHHRVALLGVDIQSNSFGFINYDGMDRLSGKAYDFASGAPEFVVIPKHVAFIFDQYERLTAAGHKYAPPDWAPMNAPTGRSLSFYRDVKADNTYREVVEFDDVPHFGPLLFYSDPLKFDLALTNLEMSIFRMR
jgi:hypothetical protein